MTTANGEDVAPRERLVQRLAAFEEVMSALAFYAEPATYHAIAFVPDLPAGAFVGDFDESHGDNWYDRPMPGARARAAMEAWRLAVFEAPATGGPT